MKMIEEITQKRIEEIYNAEIDGRCLVLPCKIGDTIYIIPSQTNYDLNVLKGFAKHNRVYEQTVQEVRIFKNAYLLTSCDGLCSAHSKFYNKSWFLVKEEAEKALEERGKE